MRNQCISHQGPFLINRTTNTVETFFQFYVTIGITNLRESMGHISAEGGPDSRQIQE
ncbi:hypothetical protein F220043C3_21170 [Enterocloster asparagiformis]